MAIIKCKMCGGDIALAADKTFGTCEYCGSTVTLPKIDDEQRAAAFNRGNHFRRSGEFDKALAVYERIVAEDDTDAEAHWCCALCRFGIEYVEDPVTYEWLPTCHRASFDSFLEDVDYLAAVEHSDGVTRRQYQRDAVKIAEVQRGILATSQNEEPFDVFICYKETGADGNRTVDSTLAQDIYYQLTESGYRVFFARITLEDKGGAEYEPYIFAALTSAKIMVAVGTKPEHFNAVWVKNEWSRFLAMMRSDRSKLLLPCYRDMDPYDLPEQLSVLQSYDMSKIGFVQDLLRGIKKVLDADKKPEPVKETVVVQQGGSNVAALIKRGHIFLEDGDWVSADKYFDKALDMDPENAAAYAGKLCAACNYRSLSEMAQDNVNWGGTTKNAAKGHLDKALRFGSPELQAELKGYLEAARQKQQAIDREKAYCNVCNAMGGAKTEAEYLAAARRFEAMGDYKDSAKKRALCLEKAEDCARLAREEAARKKEEHYRKLCAHQQSWTTERKLYDLAIEFEKMGDYADCPQRSKDCYAQAEQLKAEREKAAKFEADMKAAYAEEYPETNERPELEKKKQSLLKEKAKNEKQSSGKGMGFILFFFILGLVEAPLGFVAEELWISGVGIVCAVIFGLLLFTVNSANVKRKKELRQIETELEKLNERLDKIDSCTSLEQFREIYTLRQTPEGRARLEAEAKVKAEAATKARAQEEQAKANAKRKRAVTRAVVIIVLVGIIVFGVVSLTIAGNKFDAAGELVEQGDYAGAKEIYIGLNYYMDSDVLASYCEAMLLAESGRYGDAVAMLDTTESFDDCAGSIKAQVYAMAEKAIELGEYETAASLFSKSGHDDWLDRKEEAEELVLCKADYDFAVELLENRQFRDAAKEFSILGDFEDSAEMVKSAKFMKLKALAQLCADFSFMDVYYEENYFDNVFYMDKEAYYEIEDSLETAYFKLIEEDYEVSFSEPDEDVLLLADYIAQGVNELGDTAYVNDFRAEMLQKADESADAVKAVLYCKMGGYAEEAMAREYEYVKGNYNTSDPTTYAFLCDMRRADYSDAAKLYDSLYKMSVDIYFNTDAADTATRLYTINYSKGSAYAHYVVKGGYEGGMRIRVLVEDRWGADGIVKEDFAEDSESEKTVLPGEHNNVRLGRASNLYYYRVTIFDASTDVQLGTATVYTPYY